MPGDLVRVRLTKLGNGEWYAEWCLLGYEDQAMHGYSSSILAEVEAHEAEAHAALVEVLRERFPEVESKKGSGR